MIAPHTPVAHAPAPARTLRWAVIGGVAVGFVVILLVVGLRRDDKPDCEKYAAKQEELALAGLTGELREQLVGRARRASEAFCREGAVSKEEADCVERATTNEESLRCSGLGDEAAR